MSDETIITHVLNREHIGEGISHGITPTCSCGWRGQKYTEDNDWMYTMIREQEEEHIQSTKK